MPKLDKTIILPNHPSADIERDAILEYIATETASGRMSSPFTREEVHRICRGHFYVSPLIVSINDQGPGLPPKKRVCRNLSKAAPQSDMPAVNDFINKPDFPTRFDMPWHMAEIVSFLHPFHRPSPFLFITMDPHIYFPLPLPIGLVITSIPMSRPYHFGAHHVHATLVLSLSAPHRCSSRPSTSAFHVRAISVLILPLLPSFLSLHSRLGGPSTPGPYTDTGRTAGENTSGLGLQSSPCPLNCACTEDLYTL
jgi:hypothetical protein